MYTPCVLGLRPFVLFNDMLTLSKNKKKDVRVVGWISAGGHDSGW
jgi:hypothetical protein